MYYRYCHEPVHTGQIFGTGVGYDGAEIFYTEGNKIRGALGISTSYSVWEY